MTRGALTGGVAVAVVALLTWFAQSAPEHATWVRVARDANYEVQIDSASVRSLRSAAHGRWLLAFQARYRTLHAQPRLHDGKPFDREIVASVVQCDSLWFKVESVDMRLGERTLVARQRMTEDEMRDAPWRRVERGTTEEAAAVAACHFGAKLNVPGNRVPEDVNSLPPPSIERRTRPAPNR